MRLTVCCSRLWGIPVGWSNPRHFLLVRGLLETIFQSTLFLRALLIGSTTTPKIIPFPSLLWMTIICFSVSFSNNSRSLGCRNKASETHVSESHRSRECCYNQEGSGYFLSALFNAAYHGMDKKLCFTYLHVWMLTKVEMAIVDEVISWFGRWGHLTAFEWTVL